MPVTIKVMIPVERSGYTGQRDQFEEHKSDCLVQRYTDGRISLTLDPHTQERVIFSMIDLQEAVNKL